MCNKYEKREIRKRAKAFHTTVVFCQFWLFYNSRMRIILYTPWLTTCQLQANRHVVSQIHLSLHKPRPTRQRWIIMNFE